MPVTINGTTGIAGVDGSAGTPAIQGSDTNTGIFYPAADTIAFGEGGTEVMRIDSAGNVGIGTTSPTQKLDVTGNTNVSGVVAMGSSFLRNKVINGDMRIDQRNAGASISSGVGALAFAVDRTYTYALGAAVTAQRVNPSLAGFTNALRVTGAVGNTYTEIGQRIEDLTCSDLAGQTVTLSFFCAASVATSVNVYIQYCNTANSFGSTTAVYSGSQAITSTMTRYSVTVSMPSAATNGIVFGLTFSGLTSGTFTVTGIQMEASSTPTPFERRLYGQELALCQRYAYKANVEIVGQAFGATSAAFYLYMPVPMRATPTLSTTSGYTSCTAGGALNAITPAINYLNNNILRIDGSSGASMVAGNATILAFPSTAIISAEL